MSASTLNKLLNFNKCFLFFIFLLFWFGLNQSVVGQGRVEGASRELLAENGVVNTEGACSSTSNDFFPKQKLIPWRSVDSSRIVEADYYGRTFEASILIDSKEYFLYKILMNIRGFPSYVSVALMDERQLVVDMGKISQRAIFFLQNAAVHLIRELSLPEAYLVVTDGRGDISIWRRNDKWYFSIKQDSSFVVFELFEQKITYVCTHSE